MDFNDAIKNTIYGSILYESDILTSPAGQRYKIVINKVVWYAIRLFIEIDPRLVEQREKELFHITAPLINVYKTRECLTFSDAKEKAAKLINGINDINNSKLIYFSLHPISSFVVINGIDAMNNPDLYFSPGDHVQIKRTFFLGLTYHHAAIYLGNKRVIQVSDPDAENRKDEAKVNEADWSAFHCGHSEFTICFPKVKFRSNLDVIERAKSQLGFYKGEYNVLLKNCQHFATSCQFRNNITDFRGYIDILIV